MHTITKPFIAVFTGLIFSVFFSHAQTDAKKSEKIQWMSFEDAAGKMAQAGGKAEANSKKMFIDFYTSWCGWCKKMDATAFQDPAVVAYMNAHYYAVKFNAETHDTVRFKDKAYFFKPEYKSNELAAMMMGGEMSYPTCVYIDENLNEIGPVPGYMTGEQLLPVLKFFAEDIYKTKKWEDYQNEAVKK